MAGSQFKRFGLPAGPGDGNVARSRHLESLAQLRVNGGPQRDLEFGAAMLSIPELDYYVIVERFPDLKSHDADIKRKAWIKFANSEVGKVYRVTARPTTIRK